MDIFSLLISDLLRAQGCHGKASVLKLNPCMIGAMVKELLRTVYHSLRCKQREEFSHNQKNKSWTWIAKVIVRNSMYVYDACLKMLLLIGNGRVIWGGIQNVGEDLFFFLRGYGGKRMDREKVGVEFMKELWKFRNLLMLSSAKRKESGAIGDNASEEKWRNS